MPPRGEYGVATCPSRNAETLRYCRPSHASVSPYRKHRPSPRDAWRSKGAGLPPDRVLFRIEPTRLEVLPL